MIASSNWTIFTQRSQLCLWYRHLLYHTTAQVFSGTNFNNRFSNKQQRMRRVHVLEMPSGSSRWIRERKRQRDHNHLCATFWIPTSGRLVTQLGPGGTCLPVRIPIYPLCYLKSAYAQHAANRFLRDKADKVRQSM